MSDAVRHYIWLNEFTRPGQVKVLFVDSDSSLLNGHPVGSLELVRPLRKSETTLIINRNQFLEADDLAEFAKRDLMVRRILPEIGKRLGK